MTHDRDETPDGPALVICAQCGHPNLEYRFHCRRCQGKLHGASNMLPVVEQMDWAPSDGRMPYAGPGPQVRLVKVLGLFVLVLLAACSIMLDTPLARAGALFFIVVLASLILRPAKPTNSAAPDTENREEGATCPGCSAPLAPYDDVCPGCGELVGLDN